MGYLPRMIASAIYCSSPEGLPGCQFCSVLAVVYGSHAPALRGHIRSLAKDGLVAELASSEAGFSVTGTKVGTEHLQGKSMERQLLRLFLSLLLGGHVVRGLVGPSDRPPRGPTSCPWRHQPILLCSGWVCSLSLSADADTTGLWTTL